MKICTLARWPALALVGAWVFSLAVAGCSDSSPGSGFTPDSGPAEPAYSRSSMVQACARMHSCGVFRLTAVQYCIQDYENTTMHYGLAPIYKALHQCVNRAGGDCQAVLACFGAATSDPACDSTYTPGCNGDVRRFCDLGDKRIYRIDCSTGGLKCGLDLNNEPFCGAGACASTKENRCAGTAQRVYCKGHGLEIEQCDWIGLACGLDRDKNTACVGIGKECSG